MIDRLIKENRSFALYRLPGERQVHFLMQQTDTPELLYRMEDIRYTNAYLMAPFHLTPEQPVVLIRPDREALLPLPDDSLPHTCAATVHTCATDDYKRRFEVFIQALRDNKFDKLVLSRQKEMQRNASFSPGKAFYTACLKYIHSYVYICRTPQTGTWIGCTPEMLLSGRNREWQTVALAGTQLPAADQLPANWDEKNKQEQRMVSDYIRKRLHAFHIPFSTNGPYTVRAGKLAHLKSDFRFQLPRGLTATSLLNDLHPTPAVCGLPKSEARQFILANEGYNRSYYSGFVGRLQPNGNSDVYVNLRCMKVLEQQLILYAGGGILPSSVLEDEWMETENKLQTILALSKQNVYG
jgi:isochorismate synthase